MAQWVKELLLQLQRGFNPSPLGVAIIIIITKIYVPVF